LGGAKNSPVTWNWKFQMYLMFLPNTPSANWIPVEEFDWSWVGSAKADTSPPILPDNFWEAGNTPSPLTSAGGSYQQSTPPNWKNTVHNTR